VTSKPVITGGQAATVAAAAAAQAAAQTQRSFFRPAPVKTDKPTPPKTDSHKLAELRGLMPPPRSTPGSARGTPLKPLARPNLHSPRAVASPKPAGHFAAGTAAADGLTHQTVVEVDESHVAGTAQSLYVSLLLTMLTPIGLVVGTRDGV